MGTRSLTRIYDGGIEILCLYRQYDGYPSDYGRELAEFVTSKKLVNGYGADKTNQANGMGCLAAQIVARFKEECGGLYVYAPGSGDVGEAYVYEVRAKRFVCSGGFDGAVLYDGTAKGFLAWLKSAEAKDHG